MNPNAKRSSSALIAFAALLTALHASTAQAVLVHKYTFNNGNANDSVGTAHGTIIDPGAVTANFTSSGQLNLSGNGGNPSNNITNDAYVNLPNGIINAAANSGTSGAISFEFWATVSQQRTWQRLGDFGKGTGAEDVSSDGLGGDYMLISPNSGRATNGLEITNHVAAGAEPNLGLTGPFPLNVQQHVVAVYDKNNTNAGANPGGTMSLYLNGVAILPGGVGSIGTGAIDPAFNLNAINDVNNWLGRSQWGGDPLFDGLYNEFRIYDHALTAPEVTASFTTGEDKIPLPTLIVNKTTGQMAIKNLSATAKTIDYYEIGSVDPDGPGGVPGGALSVAGWNSLSDQNIDAGLAADFDNSGGAVNAADLDAWRTAFTAQTAGADANFDGASDGDDLLIWQRQLGKSPGEGDSWDEAGGSSNLKLIEAFLNGGTTLAPNQQVSLGAGYNPAIFGANDGNLTFKFGLRGEPTQVDGLVQYVTVGPAVGVPEPGTIFGAVLAMTALFGCGRSRRCAA